MMRRLSLVTSILLFACAAGVQAQQACPQFTLTLSQPITSGQPVLATFNASYFDYLFSLSVEEVISSQTGNGGSGGGKVQRIAIPVTGAGFPNIHALTFTPPDPTSSTVSYAYSFTPHQLVGMPCLATATTGTFDVAASPTAQFSGNYALLLRGISHSAEAGAPLKAEIGSITADGKGNISSGEIDINSASATFERLPVTGTYTLDARGAGKLRLKTDEGTLIFALTLSTGSSGQELAILEDDATGTFGSGTLSKQILPATLAGTWTLDLTGEQPCTAACSLPGGVENQIFTTGSLTFTAAGAVMAVLNTTADLKTKPGSHATGAIPGGGFDDAGRLNFTLSAKGGKAPDAQNYVGYFVSPTRLLILSLDPPQSYQLLSGSAQ